MPEKRSDCLIEIHNADRGIDLTLNITFDWLADGKYAGAVENPTVEIIRGTIWFGDYGADMKLDTGDNWKQIAREIETRYASEIIEAVLDQREAQRLDAA